MWREWCCVIDIFFCDGSTMSSTMSVWASFMRAGACALLLKGAALVSLAGSALAHGYMAVPAARNVIHQSNWCPQCLNAGGPWKTYGTDRVWPDARHGACGDPYDGAKDHERGGRFATGVLTGTYSQGQTIRIRVTVMAAHKGRFSFGVCPDGESQACFDAHPLVHAADGSRYWWLGDRGVGDYDMDFRLPIDVSCSKCVLQWHYETGNSCGLPGDRSTMVDCERSGAIEEFWNCADVRIDPSSDVPQSTSSSCAREEDAPHRTCLA